MAYTVDTLELVGITREFFLANQKRGIGKGEFCRKYCRRFGENRYGLDFHKKGTFSMVHWTMTEAQPNICDTRTNDWDVDLAEQGTDLSSRIDLFRMDKREFNEENFGDYFELKETDEDAKGYLLSRFPWPMNCLLAQFNNPGHPHTRINWMYLQEMLQEKIKSFLRWAKEQPTQKINTLKRSDAYARVRFIFL